MTAVHRIARADWVAQPWRNGGGVTHELWRDGDPFGVRLSAAIVASDGPFSRFDGIDRVITLLEGRGFRLTRTPPDARTAPLVADVVTVGAPFAFHGEDPWTCALVDGPVLDFNVMVDRARFRAVVAPIVLDPGEEILLPAGFALALDGDGDGIGGVRVDGLTLGRHDLAVLEQPALVSGGGRVLHVRALQVGAAPD